MATLTINNISENVTVGGASGSLVEITLRSNGQRMLHIYTSDTVASVFADGASWTFSADNVASLNFGYNRASMETSPGSGVFHPGITLGVTIAGEVRGTYFFTITYIGESGLSSLRVKVNIVASGTAVPSNDNGSTTPDIAPWLPRTIIDLNFDLRTRAVTSAFLDAVKALKIGDELVFGVLPTIGGTPIVADVTELSLAVRAPDEFDEDDFLFLTTAGVTLVDAGDGHSYYSLPVTLDSFALRDWFDALNGKNPAPATDQLRTVNAMADLRLTHDGRVVTSETFALPIQQPVNALV